MTDTITTRDAARPDGFYWVRPKGEGWQPAQWVAPEGFMLGYWLLFCSEEGHGSEVLEEIDESRIVREEPRRFSVVVGEDGVVRYEAKDD